jgi:hypothetical protein
MGKVISLRDRLEQWTTSYHANGVCVEVSTHGRTRLGIGVECVYLDLVDGVDLLGRLSKSIETQMSDLYEEA